MSLDVLPYDSQNLTPRNELYNRVSTRVATAMPVGLHIDGLPGPIIARSSDIGTGGTSVSTPTPFSLQSLKRVEMWLPTGQLMLPAEGRWQREVSTSQALLSGVRFTEIAPGHQGVLWDFVRDRAATLARFLHDCSELSDLVLSDAMELSLFTRLREVSIARTIYRQGQNESSWESIFIILKGTVSLQSEVSGSVVKLDVLGEGQVFGGLSTIVGVPPVETARAESEVELLEIDEYTFRYFETAKPELARRITRGAIRKYARYLGGMIDRVAIGRPE